MEKEPVSLVNVLLKLDCGHLRLLHQIRSDSIPDHAWCNTHAETKQVIDSVDNRPLLRADNGRSF